MMIKYFQITLRQCSFNNYSINKSNIGEYLEVLLTPEDECIEASKHKTLPWYGIMWHL